VFDKNNVPTYLKRRYSTADLSVSLKDNIKADLDDIRGEHQLAKDTLVLTGSNIKIAVKTSKLTKRLKAGLCSGDAVFFL
jgi:hypothetical protein